ncbi:MAG: hypothetical protein AAF497_18455, partial [Planctomycetota bacterium]
MIVFHEQVQDAKLDEDASILTRQNFFRHGSRHEIVDGLKRDKFVTDEFVIHTVYGCEMVVTNTASSPQVIELLFQVPKGAIPIAESKYTETMTLEVPAYSTASHAYFFYFPTSGTYEHFPVHVAVGEKTVSFAKPFTFNVVDEPTQLDSESWDYVSQNGTNEEVMEFLKSHN